MTSKISEIKKLVITRYIYLAAKKAKEQKRSTIDNVDVLIGILKDNQLFSKVDIQNCMAALQIDAILSLDSFSPINSTYKVRAILPRLREKIAKLDIDIEQAIKKSLVQQSTIFNCLQSKRKEDNA